MFDKLAVEPPLRNLTDVVEAEGCPMRATSALCDHVTLYLSVVSVLCGSTVSHQRVTGSFHSGVYGGLGCGSAPGPSITCGHYLFAVSKPVELVSHQSRGLLQKVSVELFVQNSPVPAHVQGAELRCQPEHGGSRPTSPYSGG